MNRAEEWKARRDKVEAERPRGNYWRVTDSGDVEFEDNSRNMAFRRKPGVALALADELIAGLRGGETTVSDGMRIEAERLARYEKVFGPLPPDDDSIIEALKGLPARAEAEIRAAAIREVAGWLRGLSSQSVWGMPREKAAEKMLAHFLPEAPSTQTDPFTGACCGPHRDAAIAAASPDPAEVTAARERLEADRKQWGEDRDHDTRCRGVQCIYPGGPEGWLRDRKLVDGGGK